MDASQHHAIDYIEFPVVDMAAAQRFYADAFGWNFTPYGDAYAGIRGKDREVGGLRLDEEVTRGGVLVVGVDSLLTQLAKCCKPAPPDEIRGFVTRGKGVHERRRRLSLGHRPEPAVTT